MFGRGQLPLGSVPRFESEMVGEILWLTFGSWGELILALRTVDRDPQAFLLVIPHQRPSVSPSPLVMDPQRQSLAPARPFVFKPAAPRPFEAILAIGRDRLSVRAARAKYSALTPRTDSVLPRSLRNFTEVVCRVCPEGTRLRT